jgi:multidrug efflux pump subunit AcrB
MRKTLDNVLITIAVVSMVAFIVAGGFMTVYFQAGMVKEYGEQFTEIVKYCFALGWMPAFVVASIINETDKKKR